jgi:V-type H+-transporting ATPase S1 subunit
MNWKGNVSLNIIAIFYCLMEMCTDFIFEQIMKEINKKSYVAIYTSYVSQSSQRYRREVRELPFVEDTTPYNVPPNSVGGDCNIQGAFNVSSPDPCLLFCVNEIKVKVNPEDSNTTTFDCTVSYPSSVSFCCVNTTSENEACAREEFTTVSLNYTIDGRKNWCSNGSEEVPGYIFIKFLFPFIVSGNKSESTANFRTSPWNVTMEITYSDSNETCPLNRRTEAGCLFEEFAIPNGLSYACSANEHSIYSSQIIQNDCLKRGNNNQTVSMFSCAYNVTATLSGLQVQPYSVSSSTFSSAYQCVGYFTPVIWMGVFSAAILLLILYCSLLCIFSMQTIDKFEDPRGQSISVEKLH